MISQWKQDASNAIEDMYGSFMLGDDAGEADRLVVILQPPPALFLGRSFGKRMWNTLGVTFTSIQNRAYVQQVEEGSPADLQGVCVKDCVQYAAVLAKEWQNPLTEDYQDISKQALERESSGQRISYSDLKRILERGMENTQTSFLSPPSVPTTISVGHSSSGKADDHLNTPRPLVLVLRRTKQRPSIPSGIGMWPRFRLDDECDVATQIIYNLVCATPTKAVKDDGSVEASTIRGLIQSCHGICFLRQNKFALGLSVHGGSGIILSKLEDGSWSPPSAISTFGMGVALGVGVCVEHFMIILQTKEALEHFMRGASFQLGVGVGAAMFSYGREAMTSATMSGALCGSTHILEFSKEDEYDTTGGNNPIDATLGNATPTMTVSDTPNHNAMIHGVTPMMAYAMSEGLYFGVSLEGTKIHTRHDVNGRTYQFLTSSTKDVTPQEILQAKVPMPPEAHKLVASLIATEFQQDLQQLPTIPNFTQSSKKWTAAQPPIDNSSIHADLVRNVKDFFYGGVAVTQQPKQNPRTLWLHLPSSLTGEEIGFISSLSERKSTLTTSTRAQHHNASDALSTASEDLTLDSALIDNNSVLYGGVGVAPDAGAGATMRVELSRKYSMSLTDITLVELFDGSKLKIRSCHEQQAQVEFEVSSPELAHIVFQGLILLIEDANATRKVRGGKGKSGTLSPKEKSQERNTTLTSKRRLSASHQTLDQDDYSSSDDEYYDEEEEQVAPTARIGQLLPEGWKSWSKIPGRLYLKKQAISEEGCPKYVHGQLLVRDVCKNTHLPLPLPLVRVLLLDSSSPVIQQWEQDSGNTEYEKTPWTFPPATPREMDQYQSEHQLIASGSMCGAHRTISYAGKQLRFSETHIVDCDDTEKLAFSVNERMPKRGFSIKVKVVIRAFQNESEATILAELRPVGKNMSNPAAVHKAFLLVLEELGDRYGASGNGLLARFLTVVANLPKESLPTGSLSTGSIYYSKGNPSEEKKQDGSPSDGVVKLEDMLKNSTDSSSRVLNSIDAGSSSKGGFNESRPKDISKGKYKQAPLAKKVVKDEPMTAKATSESAAPTMIEVKPLPKIRLSLMPSPREEDEDKEAASKRKKKKEKKKKDKQQGKTSSSTKKTSTWTKMRKQKGSKV